MKMETSEWCRKTVRTICVLPLPNSAVKMLIDAITLRNFTHFQQHSNSDFRVWLEFPLPFPPGPVALAARPATVLHLHYLEM
mgnify:CR=1 FL=1